MTCKHKAWVVKENKFETIYSYGWIILYRSNKTEIEISNTRWYKNLKAAKKACMRGAELLKLKIEWIEGIE